MQRIAEPELMDDPAQAKAYAEADFEQPHSTFIRLFREAFPGFAHRACVLDLGCGPGDITFRFARAYPQCRIHGVDGSDAMLAHAKKAAAESPELQGRVVFLPAALPGVELPLERYDAVISNSLLHHLADPSALWHTVKAFAAPGAAVFIMDLQRPASRAEAQRLTGVYARGEPEVLRRDFYNSLLAAFTVDEIREQLRVERLAVLDVRTVSDRHVLVSGRMEG